MALEKTVKAILAEANPTGALKLADKYMEVYRLSKKHFILPDEHKYLLPIIKAFVDDSAEFAKFILEIRDRDRQHYKELNSLYRSVFTRAVQQERRARADHAVMLAIEAHGEPPSFQKRLSWIARREADWASKRLAFLAEARRHETSGRLSRGKTTELLKEFWGEIDKGLTVESIPDWES